MNKNKVALLGVNEILGSFLSHLVEDSDVASLMSDPKSYLFEKTNMDFGDDISLHIVSNGDNLYHLSLPYYTDVEGNKDAVHILDEAELDEIHGGEFVVGAGLILSGATFFLGAAIVGAGFGAYVLVEEEKDKAFQRENPGVPVRGK